MTMDEFIDTHNDDNDVSAPATIKRCIPDVQPELSAINVNAYINYTIAPTGINPNQTKL